MNRLRYAPWAVLLVFLLQCASHVPPAKVAANYRGLWWKVSDSNSHVWVLGSIHMADSTLYPLPQAIMLAFDSASALAVEINISDTVQAMDVTRRMMQAGVYGAGERLVDHIPDTMAKSIDSLMQVWDLPFAALNTLKPWLASVRISALAIERTGIAAQHGIDVHLLEKTHEKSLPVVSLETASQQAEIFGGLPDSTQVRMLEWTMQSVVRIDDMVDSLFLHWKNGDSAALHDLVFGDEFDRPEFATLRDRVYTQRNRVMAKGIAQMLQDDRPVFVVVGAAHLLGPQSVLELLAEQGMRVEKGY